MIYPIALLIISAMGCASAIGYGQQAKRLVSSEKPDIRLDHNFSHKPVPKWENGYFLAVDMQPENAPQVTVFTSSGAKLFETSLVIDGSYRILPKALAASAKGTFAVAGSAYGASGGVSFIALFDMSGHVKRVVKLDDFAAVQLCFTDDSRLWAAGRAITYPGIEGPPDHHVIRVYDQDGKLERSLLPRSSFPTGKLHPISKAYLAANRHHVVLFSKEAHRLVGISHSGEVVFSKHAELPSADAFITGFSISDSSEILMSCQISGDGIAAFYRWNEDADTWVQIHSRSMRETNGYHAIFGFKGEHMLVSWQGLSQFSWVRIEQ